MTAAIILFLFIVVCIVIDNLTIDESWPKVAPLEDDFRPLMSTTDGGPNDVEFDFSWRHHITNIHHEDRSSQIDYSE